MFNYSGETIGDVYQAVVKDVLECGIRKNPRGKWTRELHPVTIELDNSGSNKFLLIPNRGINYAFAMAEIMWILGGRGDYEFIGFYNKNMKSYLDDTDGLIDMKGLTTKHDFHSAYGKRIRRANYTENQSFTNFPPSKFRGVNRSEESALFDRLFMHGSEIDQLQMVYEKLQEDMNSRQAIVSLWDVRKDNLFKSRDFPCNTMLMFTVNSGKLDLSVIRRSNDCFTYDTKIKLLDGTEKEIGWLAENYKDKEFWVYSCDKDGNIVAGKAHSCKKSKEVNKIAYVTLDNGEVIQCTPEHKFMIRTGEYREAQYLQSGDSLMPLYYKLDHRGYELIKNNRTGKFEPTHSIVAKGIQPESFNELSKYYEESKNIGDCVVTHHKDCNKHNNTPHNLEVLLAKHHIKKHQDDGRALRWLDGNQKIKQSQIMRDVNTYLWTKREGFREYIRPISQRNIKKAIEKANTPEILAKKKEAINNSEKFRLSNREKILKVNKSLVHRERVSKRMKAYLAKPETMNKYSKIGSKVMNKIINENCPDCGKFLEKHVHALLHKRWCKVAKPELALSNHKVVSVKIKKLDTPIPVYDFTVEKYHNFALSSGIFVHNCIWGLPYNIVQFTSIQEYMAGWLGLETGKYIEFINSLHIYEKEYPELLEFVQKGIEDDNLVLPDFPSELVHSQEERVRSKAEMDRFMTYFFKTEAEWRLRIKPETHKEVLKLYMDRWLGELDSVTTSDYWSSVYTFLLTYHLYKAKHYDLVVKQMIDTHSIMFKSMAVETFRKASEELTDELLSCAKRYGPMLYKLLVSHYKEV